MRVVVDPNVLISAFITPRGASARILIALREGAFELIASPALLAELRSVLLRPKFRPYVSVDEVEAFVDLVQQEGIRVDDPEHTGPRISVDPGDEYLIDLARAARADALVSGDPHLLRLRSELPVRSPREFLDSLTRPDGHGPVARG